MVTKFEDTSEGVSNDIEAVQGVPADTRMGEPIFRAKLPAFVTTEWVADLLTVSETVQKRIAMGMADVLPNWTGTEVEDGVFAERLAQDLGIVWSVRIIAGFAKSKKGDPLIDPAIQRSFLFLKKRHRVNAKKHALRRISPTSTSS